MNSYEHIAKVTEILPDGKMIVEVNKVSACASCSLKSGCGVSSDDSKNKYTIENTVNAEVGNEILIRIEQKDLYKSIFLVYILPVFFILLTAVLIDYFFKKEIYTAIFSLAAVILYFIALKFILKNKESDIRVKIIG